MIALTKNSVNQFTLDCSPNVNTSGIFYFEFTHLQQRRVFDLELEDLSPFPNSFNLFELDLPTDEPDMTKTGDYEYKVFDTPQKENIVAIGFAVLSDAPRDNKVNQVATGNNKIHED